GIMGPREGYDLVKALKENVKVPIVVHTHATTGLGYMTLFKCVEAGADVIDTAISSFSGGTSQPATETLAYALRKFGYENNLDIKECVRINDYFKAYKKKCFGDGTMSPVVMGTQSDALIYQIPGGMLSNLVAQLTAQNKLDKLDEVLEETPKVRKDLGYPPLVTPMSQMVGVQAATNVLSGERYKVVSKEIENYIRGEYGKAPGEVNPELQKKILGDEKPVECRYADLLEPGFEKAKAEIGSKARSDEDVLSYIAFPAQAEAFFEKRETKEKNTFNYKIARID
ncbi:MAG: oxaloacetate decarboxylase subunit alpha, partial [Clostridia bacterium]|nr:oxaloacetate decarboxylase subunit alpha [Clostridia bacterium]